MHHNEPNNYLPWTLKATHFFRFKNGGMPLFLPSDNICQQKRAIRHRNTSQQKIKIYLSLSTHWTPILNSLHQKTPIKHYQDHYKFILLKIKLFLPLKNQYNILSSLHHKHWQRLWNSYFCCLCHKSSTWITWTQSSRPCDILSPFWRRKYPTIPP